MKMQPKFVPSPLAGELRGEYPQLLKQLETRLESSLQAQQLLIDKNARLKSKIEMPPAPWKAVLSLFVLCPISIILGLKYLVIFFLSLSVYLGIEFLVRFGSYDEKRTKLDYSHLVETKHFYAEQARLRSEITELIKEGLVNRHKKAERNLISGNQSSLDKKEFVEASRVLMEHQRGDAITIYDEAKIQNDLEALTIKASYEIKGDHIDNRQSVYIEKVDQSSTIHQAATDSIVVSEADAKREILKLLHTTPSGRASIVELMVSIKADELIIRKALDSLMIQDLVKIGNREDGVIVYSIDYLTS